MEAAGRSLELFKGRSADSPLVILNTVHGEGRKVYEATKSVTDADFSMVAVGGLDWNCDMAPWDAPPVYGDESFVGGADGYLDVLLSEIIPKARDELSIEPVRTIIAGYSMGGLFAVYSLFRTDAFSAAVSGSGSFWFPGFLNFVRGNSTAGRTERLYLSLGDRESRTKNPVTRTVQANTEEIAGIFSSRGTDTVFELNPGNHFQDPSGRMAKGIAWTLR